MYKTIVKRRIRGLWHSLNHGDHGPILRSFAPRFEYTFVGDTPLGGTRHTLRGADTWFRRVFELFPGAQFELRQLLVQGWPWNTTAAAHVVIHATVGGHPYVNEFAQFAQLRWGRVKRLRTIEDTQRMAEACRVLAAEGVAAATATPIED